MDRDTSEIGKLTERIAKDPKSKLFVPLAEEYKKTGDIEMAIHVLTEGLKNNPGYVTARSFLGRVLIDKGDLAGAQKEFEEVVKAIPDNLLAQRKLGDIYALQGRPKDALACYRSVIALNPKDRDSPALIADLEAGRDITSKIGKPVAQQPAAPAAHPAPPKPPLTTAHQAAAPEKPLPEVQERTNVIPPASRKPGQEAEVAEEVLVVEPLEAELILPHSIPERPHEPAPGGFDFLAEGKMDAGEGPIPGLEVSIPGGFFEDAPPDVPGPQGGGFADEGTGEAGELPVLLAPAEEPELAGGGSAQQIKKSDDFTTDTLAELYISQGFYEKAIDIYDRMLAENPGHQGLIDKLNRLHALAEEAGGGGSPDKKSEEEPVQSFDLSGGPESVEMPHPEMSGGELAAPPAFGEPDEMLSGETAFEPGKPFERMPFPGMEQEAKEYVPPLQDGSSEELPSFGGGFDLSEKELPLSHDTEEAAPADADAPSPAVTIPRPDAGRSAKEPPAGFSSLHTEESPLQPQRGPHARMAKDARKDTISRLELWLKNIAKEK